MPPVPRLLAAASGSRACRSRRQLLRAEYAERGRRAVLIRKALGSGSLTVRE